MTVRDKLEELLEELIIDCNVYQQNAIDLMDVENRDARMLQTGRAAAFGEIINHMSNLKEGWRLDDIAKR